MTRSLLTVILICFATYWSLATAEQDTALEKAYLQVGTGDVRPVLSFLDSVSISSQPKYSEILEKYEKRFIERDEQFHHEEPFISQLYQHYVTYWQISLVVPNQEADARRSLFKSLKSLLRENGRRFLFPNIEKIENALTQISSEKGYKLLLGKTGPLRELMIWKKEERVVYDIELPHERFSTEVVFLNDFYCKGWYGFATFDVKNTGGWTSEDVIYRVGPRPIKETEWFRVSLLGHEGRHILDKRLYGSIENWILEYRAKLTELILAQETFHKLLDNFGAEARNKKSVPHAFASYEIVRNLKLELKDKSGGDLSYPVIIQNVEKERIKGAAQILLERSTKSLEATVTNSGDQ